MTDYERLTRYMQVGNKVVQVIPQRKERIQNYVDRLFDLEDKIESGELISKKEVEGLKSENVALRNEADENAALSMENKMRADRLEAENAALRERLEKTVELPCKVGDTIYSLDHFDLKIRENKVIAITFLLSNSVNHLEVQAHNFRGAVASFESIDFGKDVFTDRSAAEARLAELKGEEKNG